MDEPGLSRYVELHATRVVADIAARRGAGPSFRLREGLWLIPVTWQEGGRLVLAGEVRVRRLDGRAEVLLVVEEVCEGASPGDLLDALVDELTRLAP